LKPVIMMETGFQKNSVAASRPNFRQSTQKIPTSAALRNPTSSSRNTWGSCPAATSSRWMSWNHTGP